MAGCDRCGTSSPFGHCLMEQLPQAQLVLLPRTLLPWALLALLALLPWTLLPQALVAQLALLPRALLALLSQTLLPRALLAMLAQLALLPWALLALLELQAQLPHTLAEPGQLCCCQWERRTTLLPSMPKGSLYSSLC